MVIICICALAHSTVLLHIQFTVFLLYQIKPYDWLTTNNYDSNDGLADD